MTGNNRQSFTYFADIDAILGTRATSSPTVVLENTSGITVRDEGTFAILLLYILCVCIEFSDANPLDSSSQESPSPAEVVEHVDVSTSPLNDSTEGSPSQEQQSMTEQETSGIQKGLIIVTKVTEVKYFILLN